MLAELKLRNAHWLCCHCRLPRGRPNHFQNCIWMPCNTNSARVGGIIEGVRKVGGRCYEPRGCTAVGSNSLTPSRPPSLQKIWLLCSMTLCWQVAMGMGKRREVSSPLCHYLRREINKIFSKIYDYVYASNHLMT